MIIIDTEVSFASMSKQKYNIVNAIKAAGFQMGFGYLKQLSTSYVNIIKIKYDRRMIFNQNTLYLPAALSAT